MIKIFEENKKLAAFTTIVIAIGIFIVSGTPSYTTEYGSENSIAIIYHFFAFFFFQLFLLITVTKKHNLEFFIPSIILSLLYSILDELHQYFIPGRICSFGDVLTDSAGIALATLMYYIYKKYLGNFK